MHDDDAPRNMPISVSFEAGALTYVDALAAEEGRTRSNMLMQMIRYYRAMHSDAVAPETDRASMFEGER